MYEKRIASRSGVTTTAQIVVLPELNSFWVQHPMPPDRIVRARNIQIAPQDHSLFELPAGVAPMPQPGFGGTMFLSAIVLQISFPGHPSRELLTVEERATRLATPEGDTLFIVTSVIDEALNRVRVRVLRDATDRPGAIKGTRWMTFRSRWAAPRTRTGPGRTSRSASRECATAMRQGPEIYLSASAAPC